jgi:hypothetical protein
MSASGSSCCRLRPAGRRRWLGLRAGLSSPLTPTLKSGGATGRHPARVIVNTGQNLSARLLAATKFLVPVPPGGYVPASQSARGGAGQLDEDARAGGGIDAVRQWRSPGGGSAFQTRTRSAAQRDVRISHSGAEKARLPQLPGWYKTVAVRALPHSSADYAARRAVFPRWPSPGQVVPISRSTVISSCAPWNVSLTAWASGSKRGRNCNAISSRSIARSSASSSSVGRPVFLA